MRRKFYKLGNSVHFKILELNYQQHGSLVGHGLPLSTAYSFIKYSSNLLLFEFVFPEGIERIFTQVVFVMFQKLFHVNAIRENQWR
jgi:hypothetical protein